MVWFRLIAFVVATLALAGCCASGNGCYVPVPGVPTAWDGAGTRPGEDPAPRRQRIERASAEAGPLSAAPPSDASAAEKSEADKSRSDRFWAQKDAGEREADARLTRRLMICRDCLPSAVGTGAVGPVR
jgi:hypothetical protein